MLGKLESSSVQKLAHIICIPYTPKCIFASVAIGVQLLHHLHIAQIAWTPKNKIFFWVDPPFLSSQYFSTFFSRSWPIYLIFFSRYNFFLTIEQWSWKKFCFRHNDWKSSKNVAFRLEFELFLCLIFVELFLKNATFVCDFQTIMSSEMCETKLRHLSKNC